MLRTSPDFHDATTIKIGIFLETSNHGSLFLAEDLYVKCHSRDVLRGDWLEQEFCRSSAALRHGLSEYSDLLGFLWTRKDHHGRHVLCIQSRYDFPSWTSRVRDWRIYTDFAQVLIGIISKCACFYPVEGV